MMWHNKLKLALAVAAMAGATFGLHAQMAQDPLLSRSASVEPNILFVLDDSGSMNSTAIYQYGSTNSVGYQGQRGPNGDAECNQVPPSSCVWTNAPTTLWGQSPDVNLMYYDPRLRYVPAVNHDGSSKGNGALNSTNSTFKVYFHAAKTGTAAGGIFGVIENSDNAFRFPGNGTCSASVTNGGSGTGATFTVTRVATSGDDPVTIDVVTPGSNYASTAQVSVRCYASGSSGTSTTRVFNTTAGRTNGRWDKTFSATNKWDYYMPHFKPDSNSPLHSGVNTATGLALVYPNTASATAVTNYPKFAARTDCTTSTQHCTWTEERQNYANWQAYHSTRIKLAKTGIGLALQPLSDTFRLGWAKINTLDNGNLDAGVRKYTPAVRQSFFSWIDGVTEPVPAGNSTPNRNAIYRAGKYFERRDDAGPWGSNTTAVGNASVDQVGATNSSTGTGGHATCRRSYAMLMTDGYYNETFPPSGVSFGNSGDIDSYSVGTVPGSTNPARSYTAVPPYKDLKTVGSHAYSFADVAMRYWLYDLRNDLPNNVRPTTSDPDANWQHMNFFAIGLGVEGKLPVNNTTLAKLADPADPLGWPAPANNAVEAIDDMWHATVNGRGKLLNAKTTDELERAITQIMSEISGQEGTQAGVAVSSISISQGTRKYEPEYMTGKWTGNLTAHSLNNLGQTVGAPAWQVEVYDSVSKTYTSKIPAHGSRNIVVGNNATGVATVARAVEFKYTPMGATLRDLMGTAAEITTVLIDYLRGDSSYEDRPTTATENALYRMRETKLGDIVNSTPVLVKNAVDLNYEKLPTSVPGYNSYRDHITNKNARAEGVLFVGANDGMLHAFRDGTYNSAGVQQTAGGAEVFAYVPYSVLPILKNLSDKTYSHRYYVDGPLSETDAFLTDRGGWRNLVMGSTGAGAGALSVAGTAPGVGTSPRTSVFALDVTSLNTSVTSLGTSTIAWEVTSSRAGFEELGYMLYEVAAGVTPSGDWVAIFGNGFESRSCKASLFVVNLSTGAKIRELTTNVGSCAAGQRNGLGGVRIVRNPTRQIIGVYAGDLLGNMWKFNLTGASSSNWSVDLGGQPLIRVGNTQPITAPPSVVPLPMLGSTEPNTGYMVTFGTGKFYEVSDISSTTQQYVYGVWDKLAFGNAAPPLGSVLTDTTLLVEQTITSQVSAGRTFLTVSTNPVNYGGSAPKRGWKIALNTAGQRVVYPMETVLNRFLVIDAISPNNVSLDPCSNATGGTGFTYLIDALDGGAPAAPILDTNGDNNVDASDSFASGVQTSADGRNIVRVLGGDGSSSGASTTGGKTYADEGLVHTGDNSIIGAGEEAGVDISIQSTTDEEQLDVKCKHIRGAVCTPPTPGGGGPVRRQWRQLYLR